MNKKVKFKKVGAVIIEARAKSVTCNKSKYIKGLITKDMENKTNEQEGVNW